MDGDPKSNSEILIRVDREISLCAISDLKPHPQHTRKHNRAAKRKLASSIRRLGFNVPVLVDKNSQILAGHLCVEAAKELGMTHVPVIFLHDLSETQAIAFMLAHNKLAELSSWDDQKLALQLKSLSEMALNFEIEATGFEQPEIDFRIQSLEDAELIDRADDFEVTCNQAVSALGDVWTLGGHRIVCGDSQDSATLTNLFAGEKAAAAITDPPYNLRVDGHISGKGNIRHREFPMASGEMSEDEFTAFLTSTLSGICNNTAPGAIFYVFMDWRHMGETLAAAARSGCVLLNVCVWVKSNSGMGSLYRSHHEFVFVFRNGSEPHRNNIQLGRFGRNRTNVWNYPGGNAFARRGSKRNLELHPTVKPVLLVADAIRDSTNRNEIVFDPFLGSGTTLLAAERTGRRCYGVELDPLYVDTAIDRWQRMTGRKAYNQLGETFEQIRSRQQLQTINASSLSSPLTAQEMLSEDLR
jgi:DNA modification methylase